MKAFSDEAQLNLHLNLRAGRNPHHVIETVFKSFARAMDQATALDPPGGSRRYPRPLLWDGQGGTSLAEGGHAKRVGPLLPVPHDPAHPRIAGVHRPPDLIAETHACHVNHLTHCLAQRQG